MLPLTNLSLETHKEVLLELFDFVDDLCESGIVLMCGDLKQTL